MAGVRRRDFLTSGALAAGSLALGSGFLKEALAAPARAGAGPYGPLQAPDGNGLMLPAGFRSRLLARGGQPVQGTSYTWRRSSDGQATFRTGDGGWILVTNHETRSDNGGGVSAIRFRPDGAVLAAYSILSGTNTNCAGGSTPWGTWLSCEEVNAGLVHECDPSGTLAPEARPALGVFRHEAAAVDPVAGRIYLTEDAGDGGFYRFTPAAYPSLTSGLLEVAVVGRGARVTWRPVPDPTTAASGVPTRKQVPDMTRFRASEGAWYHAGIVYFTTKSDKKVWGYDTRTGVIDVLFDRSLAADSSLDAVDNVTVTPMGEVLVCEDGGNMEIGLITPERAVSPLLRFEGREHSKSEVCGVVFDPSGTRMYCTSQGAFPDPLGIERGPGAVYEISGPFRIPRGGVPRELVFGPPAGELRPGGPLNPGPDRAKPALSARATRRAGRSTLLGRGLGVRLGVGEAASVSLALTTHDLARVKGRGGTPSRAEPVTLARGSRRMERGGSGTVRLRVGRTARRRLARRRTAIRARVTVEARDAAGNRSYVTRTLRIGKVRSRRSRRRAPR